MARIGMKRGSTALFGMALAAAMLGGAPGASAEGFFSALFGALSGRAVRSIPPPSVALPFAPDDVQPQREAPTQAMGGGGQAYCVRTCDGRHFPAPGQGHASFAEACKSFCPASTTQVFYGSAIDHARTREGKAYSDLPNAFRYRQEMVANCTCRPGEPLGLARIDIQDDPTLRKGDVVATDDGLKVATTTVANRKSGNVSLTSVSSYRGINARERLQLERIPIAASE